MILGSRNKTVARSFVECQIQHSPRSCRASIFSSSIPIRQLTIPTTVTFLQSSIHSMSHSQGDIVVHPNEAPPLYDDRPLPTGWIYEYDTTYRARLYVDIVAEPPRSSWVHPLDDPIYTASVPDTSPSLDIESRVQSSPNTISPSPVNPSSSLSRTDNQPLKSTSTSTSASTSMSTSTSGTKTERKRGLGEWIMDGLTQTSREERRERGRKMKEILNETKRKQQLCDEAMQQRLIKEREEKEARKRAKRAHFEAQVRRNQQRNISARNNRNFSDWTNLNNMLMFNMMASSSCDAGTDSGGGGGGCGGDGGGGDGGGGGCC